MTRSRGGCDKPGTVPEPNDATTRDTARPLSEPTPDATRTAGRGGLAVAGAKLWFIAAGLVQQTVLPHLVGLDGYGAYSLAQSIANIPNNVLVGGSIQSVSKTVAAAGPGGEASALRRALGVHAVMAPVLAGALAVAAPALAEFEHAPHLVLPLRIFAVVLFAYALYAPLVGSLNGRRRFGTQAALDVTAATLRTLALLGGGALLAGRGLGVVGAVGGVALAALAMLPIAVSRAGTGARGDAGATPRAYLSLFVPLAASQLFLNLLMQADIWLLRRFTLEAALASPSVAHDAAQKATDTLIGAYRAAQLFAFLPYQLLVSVTFVLFPMLAKAQAEGDRDAVARYASTGIRLGLVLAGLMVGTVCAMGPHLVRMAFPAPAHELAGDALRVLALGQGAFAIFGIEAAALASLGHERRTALLTACAVAAVAALSTALVPGRAFGPALLVASASATSLALLGAAIAGGVLVRRVSGGFASAATLARVALGMAVAFAVGRAMPWLGKLAVPAEAALIALSYVVTLVATRELGAADLATVRRVVGRR